MWMFVLVSSVIELGLVVYDKCVYYVSGFMISVSIMFQL